MVKDQSDKELKGVCFFYSETGTEGGYWAFQDECFIKPAGPYPCPQFDYKGLHILKNDDLLTIYNINDPEKIVWEGIISLKLFGLFTERANGYWIHADQDGIDRETWAEWFFKEYPAKLLPAN